MSNPVLLSLSLSVVVAKAWASPPLEALTTGYWTRQYEIPDYYSTITAVLNPDVSGQSGREVEKLLLALGGRLTHGNVREASQPHSNMEGETLWEVPTVRAREAVSALQRLPSLSFFRGRGEMPPLMEELVNKRDGLLIELGKFSELERSPIACPLLGNELQTLDWLIERDRQARDTTLLIVKLAPVEIPMTTHDPSMGPFEIPRRSPNPAGVPIDRVSGCQSSDKAGLDFWRREAAVGNSRMKIVFGIESADKAETANSLERLFKKTGATFIAPPNDQFAMPHMRGYRFRPFRGRYIIPVSRVDGFRDELAKKHSLVYWNVDLDPSPTFSSAAEKRQRLSAEIERLSSVLSKAPLTRTLFEAEVERLSNSAASYSHDAKSAELKALWMTPRRP